MASPSQSEHFKGLPEPLQQRALREQSTRLASDGQIPLLPDSFATPPKRFSAKAEATPYPNFEKTTPPPEVTPAAQMKLESAGASTGPVPVMQGIKVLIEEKEKELTALSERRARGVEAHAK